VQGSHSARKIVFVMCIESYDIFKVQTGFTSCSQGPVFCSGCEAGWCHVEHLREAFCSGACDTGHSGFLQNCSVLNVRLVFMCMKTYGVSCGTALCIPVPGISHGQYLHREAPNLPDQTLAN
jgi:hypothetical protein